VSAAYLSPTGVAKSKDCCRLSNAAAPLPRFTMFLAGTVARPCAATSRRDVPRSWRLPRLQKDSRERPRSPLADLGHILSCSRWQLANAVRTRHACPKRVIRAVFSVGRSLPGCPRRHVSGPGHGSCSEGHGSRSSNKSEHRRCRRSGKSCPSVTNALTNKARCPNGLNSFCLGFGVFC
jgi:hypothetical protein